MSKTPESGSRPCACRDCFETAIGGPGAMCHECEDAGCPGDRECQASGAYGGEDEEPERAESIRSRLVYQLRTETDPARRAVLLTEVEACNQRIDAPEPELVTADLIRGRCAHAGFCVISDAEAEPALVVERLLAALGALDPEALDAFISPESPLLSVPNEAAADRAHPFWDTAEATAITAALALALNRAAPAGFVFALEAGTDRLGFFRC